MALTLPYPLDFLSDILRLGDVTWDVQRNDETSGSGDGQFWSAELARPLWTVEITLGAYYLRHGREIDAKIRALGLNKAMLFADPTYEPARLYDPGDDVTVAAIGDTRVSLALTGLPAGYEVAAGDRLSIVSGETYYFGEFSEGATASSTGETGEIAVFPPLFFANSVGGRVEMARPVLKAVVVQDGHTPHTTNLGRIASGASLSLRQKV
jgi:hypothetical protein